jgi:mono/diheme cytochrome c family protein
MRVVAPTSTVLCALALLGCRQDMHDQPRKEPLEKSDFFADHRSARPQVAGTIARGELVEDELLATGMVDGKPSESFPFEVTAQLLARGRERYDISCAPCHGPTGAGDGMIVQRGMRAPASFDLERLRAAPPGYFFDVMTRGFGAMLDVADRVALRDRWAIAAYVRALQLSQRAERSDLSAADRAALGE